MNNWISVDKEMPHTGPLMTYETYIVSNGGRGFECKFMNGEWYQDFSGCGPRGDITHWQPLPSPPETKP